MKLCRCPSDNHLDVHQAEAHLRPSEEFVSESVTRALADFETRLEPQRCLPLQEAIVAVRKSLSALRRAGP